MNSTISPEPSHGKDEPFESVRTAAQPRKTATARVSANSKFFFQSGRKYFVKAVTYGPFPPRIEGGSSEPIYFPERSKVRFDLDLMRQAGINTVRVYYVPPPWFLEECEANHIKAFITIPWGQHVSFLDSKESRRSIRKRISDAVSINANHPSVFAYAVGNEIPTGIVRWYGSYKVESFLESLIDTARQLDPKVLYTYANYPSTEYILPGSLDFFCYNVYLHKQIDFERYLARLQNLAGEKPLMIGECGMDTVRHTHEEQSELLEWHVQSVARMGLAGTTVFSWTDEWFTGGRLIEDWKFGIVDADRKPKKAYYQLQKLFKDAHRVPLKIYPSVSVVVCSYNGARTLEACLTSLEQVDYPDYEIILVDDGSTDNTQEIVKQFPKIKNIKQKNLGLSFARNVGMQAARGEVIAYTDSDCMADKDWLYYLIGTLEEADYVSVGGPNISPPAQSWAQACVAVSPGQPSHVLISDSEAEHIPGCNMAFYKWALEAIGGFDPEYRKAGDDVDVCWRLMQLGYKIGFSPSAIVWHHRRFSTSAYFKQQSGYGEAEALLRFKHFVYFGPTGSAKWRGCVYGPTHFSSLFQRPIVYHGVFGMGLFQCIYPKQTSDFVLLMGSLEWNALTLITLAVALEIHSAWYVPAALFACTVAVSLSYGFRARVEPPYQGFRSHLLVSVLAFFQPIRRGWARYSTWMRQKRTPGKVLHSTPEAKAVKIIWDRHALLSFWSEDGKGREQFLSAFENRLDQEGWRFSTDTGWTNWDYQVYGNSWWQTRVLTVTEEHGSGKRLTRVRLHPSATILSRFILLIMSVISLLAFLKFWNPLHTESSTFLQIGSWFTFVSLWLTFLVWRSASLRKRVAQLVELAAMDCKLTPIQGSSAKMEGKAEESNISKK